jgi:hypothetical protein
MDPKSLIEVDPERQANALNSLSPEVPDDGSLRGWAVVAGSWLASESQRHWDAGSCSLSVFCTFGYANSWGVFQVRLMWDLTRTLLTNRHTINRMDILSKEHRPYRGSVHCSSSSNSPLAPSPVHYTTEVTSGGSSWRVVYSS